MRPWVAHKRRPQAHRGDQGGEGDADNNPDNDNDNDVLVVMMSR